MIIIIYSIDSPIMLFNLFSSKKIKVLKYSLVSSLACLSAISFTAFSQKDLKAQEIIPDSSRKDFQEVVTTDSSSLKIVTTFLPIHLFTKAVVGETATIDILIDPGTEVHDYQSTPSNVVTLSQADILVKNGLGLEEFLEGLINNASNSDLEQINSSEGIEPLKVEESEHHDHSHHHGHSHGEGGDPHVWLDPVLAQQQIANIRDSLIKLDSNNAEIYNTNADVYINRLKELDNEFSERLTTIKGCKFVTFHDAFAYLAKRYGLEQMAVVEIPEDNITPRDIRSIKKAVKKGKVKALFSEPGIEDKRIQQIAQDFNLGIEKIDPLEDGDTDPQYYIDTMRNNLSALERGCS